MESLFHYVVPPSRCGYLPHETWQLEYEVVGDLRRTEYMERLRQGWRRFGASLFRPHCPECTACRSVRLVVDRFRPNRSQSRVAKANRGLVQLRIGKPSVSRDKLALYDKYHAFQADAKDWPVHATEDVDGYVSSFVDNPFATQEWCYYLGAHLIGVGYVDDLPQGLSAIYFFYDPEFRGRSLGTWNVLNVIERAAAMGLPHVYLGYFVDGCSSMEYKVRFRPNQLLGPDGQWRDYLK